MSTPGPLLVAMAGGKPRARWWQGAPVPKEEVLHRDVAKLLRDHALPQWQWTHVGHGANYTSAREGARMKALGVCRGWPDFVFISPYGSVRCLELKRLGGELTEEQEAFRMWCIPHGVPYVVAWTMDQVLAAMDSWGCLRIKIPR